MQEISFTMFQQLLRQNNKLGFTSANMYKLGNQVVNMVVIFQNSNCYYAWVASKYFKNLKLGGSTLFDKLQTTPLMLLANNF